MGAPCTPALGTGPAVTGAASPPTGLGSRGPAPPLLTQAAKGPQDAEGAARHRYRGPAKKILFLAPRFDNSSLSGSGSDHTI